MADAGGTAERPGVYLLAAHGARRRVHEWVDDGEGPAYGLEDVVRCFGLGRIEERGAHRDEVVLALAAGEVRELKVMADAYGFDYQPGFVEMCVEMSRAAVDAEQTVRFAERL